MLRPIIFVAALLAGAVFTTAQPAQAVPVPIEGYAWANQPGNPDYFLATGYEYNSAGAAIEVIRFGVGNYQVRFHNMAGPGGIAHASAYGTNFLCTIVSYGPSGVDEVVNVRCFTTAGAAVDTRFIANVTNRVTPGSFGYLWSDDPTPPAGHIPPAAWSYDSAGLPIVVDRSAVGQYQVQLGAFAMDNPNAWKTGYLHVTAYATSAKHCQIMDPRIQPDPTVLEVHCYDDTGFAVDSRFTLTYARKLGMLGAAAPHDYATVDLSGAPYFLGWNNSSGGVPTFTVLGMGSYEIAYPNAGVPHGHAIGAIMGTPPMFCTIQSWWQAAGWEHIWIRCYDGNNGAANPAIMLNAGFLA